MGFRTKAAAHVKQNTFWREVILSDDELGTQSSPTQEELRRRDYEIYLSQGATHGRDLEDWLQFECEYRFWE